MTPNSLPKKTGNNIIKNGANLVSEFICPHVAIVAHIRKQWRITQVYGLKYQRRRTLKWKFCQQRLNLLMVKRYFLQAKKKILDNLPFQEMQENEGISEISVFFSLLKHKNCHVNGDGNFPLCGVECGRTCLPIFVVTFSSNRSTRNAFRSM